MASNIDVTVPPQGAATTAAVRANFLAAKTEILALQAAIPAAPLMQGLTQVDFGAMDAIRGDAEFLLTGLTGILTTSSIECSLRIEATADHDIDDMIIDAPEFLAGKIIAGTGFSIFGSMEYGTVYGKYNLDVKVRA